MLLETRKSLAMSAFTPLLQRQNTMWLCIFYVMSFSFAEEITGVDQLIHLAQNSFLIQSIDAQIEQENRARDSISWQDPNIKGSIAPLTIASNDASMNSVGMVVGIRQVLPLYDILDTKRAMQEYVIDIIEVSKKKQQLQLQENILVEYGRWCQMQEMLLANRSHQAILEQQQQYIDTQRVSDNKAQLWSVSVQRVVQERKATEAMYVSQIRQIEQGWLRWIQNPVTGSESYGYFSTLQIQDLASLPHVPMRSVEIEMLDRQRDMVQQNLELRSIEQKPQVAWNAQYNNLMMSPTGFWTVGVDVTPSISRSSDDAEIAKIQFTLQSIEAQRQQMEQDIISQRLVLEERWNLVNTQLALLEKQQALLNEESLVLYQLLRTSTGMYTELLNIGHKQIAVDEQIASVKNERWSILGRWYTLHGYIVVKQATEGGI